MTITEKGTYVVTATLTDELGVAVAPTTATWTLLDSGGNVVNARTAVTLTVTSGVGTVVLSGLDLAVGNGDGRRVLRLDIVYTSTNGSGLTMHPIHTFTITPSAFIS